MIFPSLFLAQRQLPAFPTQTFLSFTFNWRIYFLTALNASTVVIETRSPPGRVLQDLKAYSQVAFLFTSL